MAADEARSATWVRAAAAPDAGSPFPLHTSGASIVDAKNKQVKLELVNGASRARDPPIRSGWRRIRRSAVGAQHRERVHGHRGVRAADQRVHVQSGQAVAEVFGER